MGELAVLSGREVITVLAAHGFVEARRRGSHVIMQRRNGDVTTTLPVPDHKQLAVGTLRSIIRQSGLSKSLFER